MDIVSIDHFDKKLDYPVSHLVGASSHQIMCVIFCHEPPLEPPLIVFAVVDHLIQKKKGELVAAQFAPGLVAGHSARYVILRPNRHTYHEVLGNRASGVMILKARWGHGDGASDLSSRRRWFG